MSLAKSYLASSSSCCPRIESRQSVKLRRKRSSPVSRRDRRRVPHEPEVGASMASAGACVAVADEFATPYHGGGGPPRMTVFDLVAIGPSQVIGARPGEDATPFPATFQ